MTLIPVQLYTPWRLALLAMATALLTIAVAGVASASTLAQVGPPDRITAMGDSITRAFDSQGSGCTAFQDCPAFSWATGSDATVNSYFKRVKAINPSVVLSSAARGNDAVTGAKVADLNGQIPTAVAGNPDLVLILIGANDVCTSSEATMTSVTNFRTRFETAISTLSTRLPDARIQVVSIPNIWNLWNVLHTNFMARLTWDVAGICQSMLDSPNSTAAADVARRARVKQRNIDFNTQLQQVCVQHIHCRYDGGAAYNIAFTSSDVSTLDYFHPKPAGQAKAAASAWNSRFNYTDLTAPTTTIERDRAADGTNDWYKDNVTVTLSATDPNSAVSGTEYFYKLVGAADAPWTKYTGPITVSAAGQTEIDARSVDVNGNIEASKSDVIKIDKTAPTFTLTCPSSLYVGDPGSITISNASDDRSGFVSDPNETMSIPDNSQVGQITHTQEIQDQAGNTTSHSCGWDQRYTAPGVPYLSGSSSTPNAGLFGLQWTLSGAAATYPGLRYALQHRDANDSDWSDVDTNLATASLLFGSGWPETEGTWTYQVKAHDGTAPDGFTDTVYSSASDQVKVDRSGPNAPTLSADRLPDYAGWFKDTVTVSSTDNGDPLLQDGSIGSGVDAGSIPGPVTETTSGSHTISETVKDNVGNESAPTDLAVQVDATDPTIGFSLCPTAVLLYASAQNTFAASDAHSGLASASSGTTTIDTSSVGTKTTSETATDNVGHVASGSCSTAVQYMFGGLQQPINPDGSSIFKLNSAIPAKFHLTDAADKGVAGAVARLEVAKMTNDIEGTFMEAVAPGSSADDTNVFKDQGGGNYQLNLKTTNLSTGTWVLKVVLNDGTEYRTYMSLR